MRVGLIVLLLAVGCGDDAPEPVEAALGGLTVRVESSPARIVVLDPAGEVVLESLPGARGGERFPPPQTIAATRTANSSFEFQVGSFRIEETGTQPWVGVEKFRDVTATDAAINFDLRGEGSDLGSASIEEVGPGHLLIQMSFDGEHSRAAASFLCDPDAHFLGFGGQTAAADHRGFTVPLWVQEDGITKAPVDTYDHGVWFLNGRLHSTHTPMPMFVSSTGYGMLLDTPAHSIFSMCDAERDAGTMRIEAWETDLKLHFFYGPSPREVVEKMTGHVGRPRLPPAFTFAPWIDAIFGSANVRRIAQELRALDIPISVIWSEDWRGGNQEGLGYVLEEDWEVDRDLYPDFEAVATDLHELGYKFLIYNNTFLDSTVPVYDEAVAGGHTIKNSDGEVYLFTGVKFEDTTLLDLSSPDAVAWAKQKYRDGLELGADGYMADFAEWLPADAVLASGEDAERAHNMYPVEWARLNRELFDEMEAEDGVERLFFVRSAYLGSQPLVSVVWAGDQQTDFTADDGMASVIPMGIGLGMTGFPYFGHDIAGYMSQLTVNTTKELWFRWVTFGALSPVMRTHHGRDGLANWHWESDAESTAHMRRWAKFHMQLFPYLYGLADQAAKTGAPMFRPLAFDYPDFEPGWTSSDQYMLGDRIIVAPVVEDGARARQVTLPPGVFYRIGDGSRADGGTTIDVAVALDDIAAFVPAGTILVMLPSDVDTAVAATLASGAVTLEDAADDRDLWLWPGGDSEWQEVGGLSYSWQGTDVTALPSAATFEGSPVTLQTDADGDFFEVTGAGTLTFDNGGTLVVSGGASDRRVVVRMRAAP